MREIGCCQLGVCISYVSFDKQSGLFLYNVVSFCFEKSESICVGPVAKYISPTLWQIATTNLMYLF